MLAKTGNEIRKRGHKTGESDKTTATGNLYGNWTDGLAERESEKYPAVTARRTYHFPQNEHSSNFGYFTTETRSGTAANGEHADTAPAGLGHERANSQTSFFFLSVPPLRATDISIKRATGGHATKTPHRNRWLKTTRNRIEIKRGISCE